MLLENLKMSHHPVMDYFPVTACVFYCFHAEQSDSKLCIRSFKNGSSAESSMKTIFAKVLYCLTKLIKKIVKICLPVVLFSLNEHAYHVFISLYLCLHLPVGIDSLYIYWQLVVGQIIVKFFSRAVQLPKWCHVSSRMHHWVLQDFSSLYN